MDKFWIVAKHEYMKTVKRRAFVLSTLGIPLMIVLVMGVAILTATGGEDQRPIGYVDEARVLAPGIVPAPENPDDAVELRAFADAVSARAALESGQVQAYFVLPAGYLQSQRVELYYGDKPPAEQRQRAFDSLVRANLLADLPQAAWQRLMEGMNVTLRSADGRREVGADSFLDFAVPFVAGFFFVFAVMMSAGYLLQVVTDEKENRTVEIAITSLSPIQLIGGKAVGLIGVALTQLVAWVTTAVVGVVIAAQFVPELQAIKVPWAFLGIAAIFFFPAYALIAGLMAAIGSSVTEMRQGQQIAGILNLLFVAPYFFTMLVLANPNHPLLVIMTLFPTTSFLTVTLRLAVTAIPAWQIITGWLLLTTSAIVSVWASARIFRVGMLRYGQQLNLRSVLAAVRGQAA